MTIYKINKKKITLYFANWLGRLIPLFSYDMIYIRNYVEVNYEYCLIFVSVHEALFLMLQLR